MAIAMLCFPLFIGDVQITPDTDPMLMVSVKTVFVIFSLFCVDGTGASYVRGTIR